MKHVRMKYHRFETGLARLYRSIKQLAWDNLDQRLAVSFADRREVALLSTRVDTKNMQFNPNVVRVDFMYVHSYINSVFLLLFFLVI